ncbi:kinesin-like protein Kip2p [[Candida] jaroonii]|uniref:Kinesin-like protein Kip2p n=1 Tax=[Candida] jaroonii TaxID=467808 RepID=A0ACA9YBH0_9ASCO|nr:kinesin-like protein Kip2p [[Candida] jaroonii]
MSHSKTPLRSRSSIGNFNSTGNNQSLSTPQNQTGKSRVSLTDFRRPPSARSTRPSSPRMSFSNSGSFSRPGSSMSNRNSRPSTPSFIKPEPYTGSIKVSIRPNPHTIDVQQGSQWYVDEHTNTIINNLDGSEFTFDNVFRPDASLSNRQIYDVSCVELVQKFLDEGYNSTVFAYGMTGSGKTYSMRGDNSNPGFVRLAIDDVFDKIENDISEKRYTVSITYLEIYNEKIVDLLNSGPAISSDLKIRDDPVYGTKIAGISSPTITSKQQMLQLINRGDNNRRTSETDFNARSSRSHAILQIRLNTVDIVSGTETNSVLSLCDLAGSEKATSSVERRKEGSFINKSLLALSTVINKLSISSNTGSLNDHIPYRDSKLTRLLQPALSGSSLVSILCTIHMGSAGISNKFADNQFVSETYNTLRFAARAKDIVVNVQKNKSTLLGEADSMKTIEDLRRTVESQKSEIALLKTNGSMNNMHIDENNGQLSLNSGRFNQLESENRILTERLEHLTRLTDLQKTETVILKNDTLNDLLGGNFSNSSSQIMIANLEEFYKRVQYEMDEYRSYISHLEQQLKIAYSENSSKVQNQPAHGLNDRQMEAVLKDQEEEIMQLKEVIKDKDHFIKSLTKTSKLRRLVDSDAINTEDVDKSNKENKKARQFQIGNKTGGVTNFIV